MVRSMGRMALGLLRVSEDCPFRSLLFLRVAHVFNGWLTWLDYEVLVEE